MANLYTTILWLHKFLILQNMSDWLICRALNVTGSAKRGLIADPNSTYLKSHNLTCEFGTTLKLGPNIPLTYR